MAQIMMTEPKPIHAAIRRYAAREISAGKAADLLKERQLPTCS
jgi:hypothetical protein